MCSIHLQHICISVNSRVTLVWTRNDLHSSWPLTFTNHCYKYNEFLGTKLRKWWIGRAVQRLGWESFTKLLRASLRFLYQTTCSSEVCRSSNISPHNWARLLEIRMPFWCDQFMPQVREAMWWWIPRHFQLANDIHKRPWNSCRAGNCPWESEPKLHSL